MVKEIDVGPQDIRMAKSKSTKFPHSDTIPGSENVHESSTARNKKITANDQGDHYNKGHNGEELVQETPKFQIQNFSNQEHNQEGQNGGQTGNDDSDPRKSVASSSKNGGLADFINDTRSCEALGDESRITPQQSGPPSLLENVASPTQVQNEALKLAVNGVKSTAKSLEVEVEEESSSGPPPGFEDVIVSKVKAPKEKKNHLAKESLQIGKFLGLQVVQNEKEAVGRITRTLRSNSKKAQQEQAIHKNTTQTPKSRRV